MQQKKIEDEMEGCTFKPTLQSKQKHNKVNDENDIVDRLYGWKTNIDNKLKKHIENEPKPTFMPKIELSRRDPPGASNKTKILGCNSFLKRMEQSRRMKQEKDAILNRFC